MPLPKGRVQVERIYIAKDGIECHQWEEIDLDELKNKEDAKPDKAAIKESLGVSSQEKGENVAGHLMERILGVGK